MFNYIYIWYKNIICIMCIYIYIIKCMIIYLIIHTIVHTRALWIFMMYLKVSNIYGFCMRVSTPFGNVRTWQLFVNGCAKECFWQDARTATHVSFKENVQGGTNSWLGLVLCPSQKLGTLQMISPSPLVRNPVVPFKSAKVIATSGRCHWGL